MLVSKLAEIIKSAHEVIHALKPFLFDLMLFLWAVYEMVRFVGEQTGLVAHP